MKGFVKLIAVVVTAAAFAVSCSKDKDSGAVSFDKPAVFIDAPSGMATVGFTLRNIKTLSVTSQPTGWDEPMLDQTTGMLTVIAPSATALERVRPSNRVRSCWPGSLRAGRAFRACFSSAS